MKPLELAAWIKDDHHPGASNTVYISGGKVLGDLVVDAKVRRKKLTDAELAAEFHRAVSAFQTANDMAEIAPSPDTWFDVERDRAWMYSTERFATFPDYDEENNENS